MRVPTIQKGGNLSVSWPDRGELERAVKFAEMNDFESFSQFVRVAVRKFVETGGRGQWLPGGELSSEEEDAMIARRAQKEEERLKHLILNETSAATSSLHKPTIFGTSAKGHKKA